MISYLSTHDSTSAPPSAPRLERPVTFPEPKRSQPKCGAELCKWCVVLFTGYTGYQLKHHGKVPRDMPGFAQVSTTALTEFDTLDGESGRKGICRTCYQQGLPTIVEAHHYLPTLTIFILVLVVETERWVPECRSLFIGMICAAL